MAKILTKSSDFRTKLRKCWYAFRKLDWFTKSSIVVMTFLIIMTPTVITTRMIYKNHAAEKFFLAASGVGDAGIFAMTEVEPKDVTDTSATISWKTSAPSRTKLQYWEDSLIGTIVSYFIEKKVEEHAYTTEHEINLSSYLEPDTKYKYIITATTKSLDVFESPSYSFRTAE